MLCKDALLTQQFTSLTLKAMELGSQTQLISVALHCGVQRSRSWQVLLLSGNGSQRISKVGVAVYSPEGMQTAVFRGLGLTKKVTSWCLVVVSQVWTEVGGFK